MLLTKGWNKRALKAPTKIDTPNRTNYLWTCIHSKSKDIMEIITNISNSKKFKRCNIFFYAYKVIHIKLNE